MSVGLQNTDHVERGVGVASLELCWSTTTLPRAVSLAPLVGSVASRGSAHVCVTRDVDILQIDAAAHAGVTQAPR
jgi:hypothetical protein